MRRLLATVSLLYGVWVVQTAALAAGLDCPVKEADLDTAQCIEMPPNPRTGTYEVKPETIAAFLRVKGPPPPHTSWFTGEGNQPVQHIRVAFTRAVAIGTVVAVTAGEISYLHPAATYPGQLDREDDWVPVLDIEGGGQVRTIPLPPWVKIRALRVSFRLATPPARPRRSQIRMLRFLSGRYINVARTATAYAGSSRSGNAKERELYGPAGLNDGMPGQQHAGQWQNQPGTPLSDANPAIAALVWDTPQKVDAVALVNTLAKRVAVDAYRGPDDVHPMTAGPEAWQETGARSVPVHWRPPVSECLLAFERPATTTALRLRFTEALTNEDPDIAHHTKGEGTHARLGELLVLRDIGNRPVPTLLSEYTGECQVRKTDNRGMSATPAPGAVSIDGHLQDWDLSGGVFVCPDTLLMRRKASAWGHVMHSPQALYVAVDFNDPTPLGNQHDPDSEPGLGWGGDCTQLRLRTDRITHITAWAADGGARPVMHVAYGESFDGGEVPNAVEHDGVAMSFRAREDGSGYAQEMRIPWTLITARGVPLRPGSAMGFTFDLRWGTRGSPEAAYGDNLAPSATSHEGLWRNPSTWGELRLAERGHLPFAAPPWLTPKPEEAASAPVAILYDLPEAPPKQGEPEYEVTLVIDDADGRRVRNLVSGARRKPGANTEPWDGLDDRGKPLPPGQYRWHAIRRAPLHLRYDFTVNHSGTPPWLSGIAGGWLSDHAPPEAVCAVGDQVFIGAAVAESGHTILAADLEGRKRWGTKWLNLAGAQCLATDGKLLYVGSEGGWIKAKLQVNVVDPLTYRFWNVVDEDFGERESLPGLSGLAVHGGKAYLSLSKPGVVRAYEMPEDPKAKGKQCAEIAVRDPRGLAFDASGRLWAASGDGVVRLDVESGTSSPLALEGVDNPRAIAFGPTGELYVSVGAPAHQVRVYTSSGTHLRTIGKPGGRHVGPYDVEEMDHPTGLALDARGRLWVAERSHCPKRVSVWTSDGTFARAFYGPTRYGGSGYLDSTDRTRLVDDGMTFILDWARRTWRLDSVHYKHEDRPGMIFLRTPGRSWAYRGRVFHANYDYWTSQYQVLYERLDDGRIVPLAAAGSAEYRIGHTTTGVAAWADARFAERVEGRDLKSLNFLWSDLNRDGEQQPSEVHFFRTPGGDVEHWPWRALWSMWIGEDGTFIMSGSGGGGRQLAWALSPVTWLPNGAPVYEPTRPRLAADVPRRRRIPVYRDVVQSIVADSQNRVIMIANPITGCDAEGKPRWTFENPWPGVHGSHSAPAWRPGTVVGGLLAIGTARLDGDLGEVFAFTGNKGQVYLFTTDGLFLAALFRDKRLGNHWNMPEAVPGMLLDDVSLGEEHFGGHFTRSSDGRYYLVAGHNHSSIVEVEDLDTVARFSGNVIIDAETAGKCDVLARERAYERARGEAPKVHTLKGLGRPVKADGRLDEWKNATFLGWETSAGAARAALAYDDTHLQLAFEVRDPSPMRNTGEDRRLLFKTGDAVDLHLGTDPEADPKRRGPVPGDWRLLISAQRVGDALTPIVMLYRHRVPGTPDGRKTTFSSPWRSEVVDDVRELSSTAVTVVAQPKLGRYTVEASIPLTELHWRPEVGTRLRGDFGVLCSDTAGETTVERSYWSNRSVQYTSDVPGEVMLYPNFWGTIVVE